MISVSILGVKNDYKDALKKINKTNCQYLHLDIADHSFTKTVSFDYDESKEISKINRKPLDIHIMSKKLDVLVDEYIKLKPDILTIHCEASDNINEYIKKIKKNDIKVGLAISPDTDIDKIYKYLSDIDVVLVLGVIPGKGGQKYIPSTTNKLKDLNKLKYTYDFLIEVDGGINNETIKEVKGYADIIVSGSFITNSDDYQEKINELNA